ncbi:hypothetical protein EDD21DRAFT_29601 [Dissophora ornata]|nr:hypothetical protein BGZ58_003829 [Dissophora ornata]KAI8603494.1 hypothetical protein EDD21DRAFT_29601 [Dissophora ornata]
MVQPQLIDKCCNTPATENTAWENLGEDKVLAIKIQGEDRKTYRTGPKDSKIGIIGVYDILGFHPTTYQFYDRLAKAHGGFQVSVPHMFKTGSVPAEHLGSRSAMVSWLDVHGSYSVSHLDELIMAAVEDLRADGCEQFVIYGQCWGTYIAIQAASDERQPFLAAGGPHPSMMSAELIEKVRCPIILLPTIEDMDMLPLMDIMKEKNLKIESFHHRFGNMHHGWTGCRGDWNIPEQFEAGQQAIHMLAEFAEKAVNANKA